MRTFIEPQKNEWPEIIQRPEIDYSRLKDYASKIILDVKQNGDAAVKKYSLQFDKVSLDSFKVTEKEISEALVLVDEGLKKAIEMARDNIQKFHASQKEKIEVTETMDGVKCWRKSVGIQKVGLYIPGGTAPLFSTLLMLAIPAQLAGCQKIIVCTPSDEFGKVNPIILYVANLLGLKDVYKIGGIHAIGAMAYGTESIPSVYKIFGPGNKYVTAAKQIISSEGIAIDMPAGPSEVAVYADESCDAAFVAADLLSQAEHGQDSQVLLVASSEKIITQVKNEITVQISLLKRTQEIDGCLKNSRFIVLKNVDDAFQLLNDYAPEHLIIASDNAEFLADKVINAGSVFLGHHSPESVGDYASGTNHTLPTNGFAKAFSGVSVDSFVKKITYQQLTKEGLKNIGNIVERMATAEGLDAHKNAVTIRLKNLEQK